MLDVPLAGTIAVVTFVTAYVPFIGAVVAGAFAVLLALGSQGTATRRHARHRHPGERTAAEHRAAVRHGLGTDLNPLVVLVVTIGAGCLFGMLGLVLAAPLTSAAVHILRELSAARRGAGGTSPEAEPPLRPPTPLRV